LPGAAPVGLAPHDYCFFFESRGQPEKWVGAGKDVDDLIHRGQIMHGAVGMAGELGHIRVVPNGNPCACGNRGCVEKHASATAVATMPRAREVWRVAGQALGA